MLRETLTDGTKEQDFFELDNPGETNEKQEGKTDRPIENGSLPSTFTSNPESIITRYGRQVKPRIRFANNEM